MYGFVGCRDPWVFLSVIFLSSLCVTVQSQSSSSSSSSSGSSDSAHTVSDLPCMDSGETIFLHGEITQMTPCSSCVCDNSTLTCQYLTCPPLTCRRRITIEGQCCKVCPYNVTVNDVIPIVSSGASLGQGKVNEVTLELKVMYAFNNEATSVTGEGLWTTRLWIARNEDGTDELSGTVLEEALTGGQQSQRLRKNPLTRTFSIEDIRYSFDLTHHKCEDAKFICAKFNKGHNPVVQLPDKPFFFRASPSEEVLTGCVANTYCKGAAQGEAMTQPTTLSLVTSSGVLLSNTDDGGDGNEVGIRGDAVDGDDGNEGDIGGNAVDGVDGNEDGIGGNAVDGDGGSGDIVPVSSSLQQILSSINEIERARLQVELDRLELEREQIFETREIRRSLG